MFYVGIYQILSTTQSANAELTRIYQHQQLQHQHNLHLHLLQQQHAQQQKMMQVSGTLKRVVCYFEEGGVVL